LIKDYEQYLEGNKKENDEIEMTWNT